MVAYNKFEQYVEDLAHQVHGQDTDQFTVALMAGAPSASLDAVLADITEISYTNLSARDITTASSAQTGGVYKLTLTDLVLTATGAVATFRYVVIYNNTPASPLDPLVSWYDHGSNVTLANGETFTIDFDDSNGFHQIA
ncbi:MAG TPA: hypothetical protein ENH62_03765 [Marinobacter sp.]|uniref:Uncharacterized protein n=1 Tax=marine sediment metagenome TaxID=412755 RepID=A0A0F9MY84_9ZZZZ|nr:hypothetical protein [Marinobacter sp.]